MHLLENVSLCLSSFSNRCPDVRHSTSESLRLGRSSQSIAFGFLCFWDSLNFKKDKEFVGITVLFFDEKKKFLSASPVSQTGVPTSVTQPSSLSVLVVVVRAWPLASSASGIPRTSRKTRSLWESRFSFLMKRFRDLWVYSRQTC
ncbi:hypothetical protein F2Q70_00024757 [Brassica cretica]|uniref:Uncharacterized protein n=1 Tax=Brassica cretica TaxID=69181 RepID=A0A8S9L101_BRACR|nr:hypothetical protein F2Q70_00024757 [Brassica cretica]